MKIRSTSAFVLGAASTALVLTLTGSSAVHGSAGGGQDPKKDAQAADVELLRQRTDAMAAELAENKKAIAEILDYLEAQADEAKAMTAVLDDSEAKGFTYGINPDSRTVLLQGWRAQLAAAQKDLPGAKKDPKKDEDAKKTPPPKQ